MVDEYFLFLTSNFVLYNTIFNENKLIFQLKNKMATKKGRGWKSDNRLLVKQI